MRKRRRNTRTQDAVKVRDTMLEHRFRTVFSTEYQRIVAVHRKGGPAWVAGLPGFLAKTVRPEGMTLRGRIRRLSRQAQERPRDIHGIKSHPTIRTPFVLKSIARRRAKGKVARRSRANNYRRAKRLGRAHA